MKFGHISDLHLGKEMYGVSIYDDQKHILNQIIKVAKEENLEAMIIAGDVYDTSSPPKKAMNLLDDFLVELSSYCKVFITPGNHDSAEFLGYGGRFMEKSEVYVIGAYTGAATKYELKDEIGKVNIYLLPFIRPLFARQIYGKDIANSEDAMKITLDNSGIDPNARNILVCHQNISNNGKIATTSGSELSVIGNDDAISYKVFDGIDYVALGHIHSAQSIGRTGVEYCGCPMVYDRKEIGTYKGMNIVELGEKNRVDVKRVPLKPLHHWTLIKGTMDELMEQANDVSKDNYVYAVLTEQAKNAQTRLKLLCNIMHVEREITGIGTFNNNNNVNIEDIYKIPPEQFFNELYRTIMGTDMSDEQMKIFKEIVESADKNEVKE